MQHNHSYTDEETTLVEHSMRLDPQKMQGVKTKLDYFKVNNITYWVCALLQ